MIKSRINPYKKWLHLPLLTSTSFKFPNETNTAQIIDSSILHLEQRMS
jgi:hypothetical protein